MCVRQGTARGVTNYNNARPTTLLLCPSCPNACLTACFCFSGTPAAALNLCLCRHPTHSLPYFRTSLPCTLRIFPPSPSKEHTKTTHTRKHTLTHTLFCPFSPSTSVDKTLNPKQNPNNPTTPQNHRRAQKSPLPPSPSHALTFSALTAASLSLRMSSTWQGLDM